MARVQWVGQSATPKSSNVANLTLINGYAEIEDSKQGRTAVAIYGTPGLKAFATLFGSGPVRSLYTASNGRCFGVSAQYLTEILGPNSIVFRGTLTSYVSVVEMADNGTTLFLVDGPSGYTMNFATNAFAQITDTTFVGANRIAFMDQYIIFNTPATQQFQWTKVNSTALDPLNFASAEGSPDLLVSLLVARRELWLFGTLTTEVWYDTGDLTNPFARIEGAFFEQGCAAIYSPARIGSVICWLSQNDQGRAMVVRADGYNASPISTYAVAEALQSYTTISDAVGWGQQWQNHLFYWLTFPTAGHTWVYDLSTNLWHERAFLLPSTGFFTRHRASSYTYAFGLHLVGDFENNQVYSLDDATYTDNGLPLRLEAVMPPFFENDDLHKIVQSYLRVDAETGVGLDALQNPGFDPKMNLYLSNDGGHNWGIERPRRLGAMGRTHVRVQWTRLGSAFDRRCKIAISDPVKRVILGAVTDVEILGV